MEVTEGGGINELGIALMDSLTERERDDPMMDGTESQSEVTARRIDASGMHQRNPMPHTMHIPDAHQLFRLACTQHVYL